MSRPPRSGTAARPVTIRATAAERAAWAAAAGDLTLSDWARQTLNRAAKRKQPSATTAHEPGDRRRG